MLSVRGLFVIALLIGVFFGSNCFPYFWKDTVFRSEGMAFFTIDPGDLDDFEDMTQVRTLEHPIDLDSARVKDLFGNLRYTKRSSVGYFSDFIFSDQEIELLARDLPFALKGLPKDKLLLGITKFDDTQSVISFDELTSFVVWAADGKLNILFGRIKREIVDRDTALSFSRWTKIEEIRLVHTTDGSEVLEMENLSFGKVDGVPQRKWVTLDLKDAGKFKFIPRKKYGPVKLTDENDRP
ncbi:hypothetical protein CH373_13850 [Leptospira perolatii]|uniref:Lipoprotein n=1 Tax=Leptospira perolatii TaxID=2023191 RepID=A0A2M9ZKK3_9LEPT|nr:hypothetical protein CH360_11415 [Leptospira perolatii]PJZ72579.1 hypothetical protein CH373_13850 [Leptospira perolatii]